MKKTSLLSLLRPTCMATLFLLSLSSCKSDPKKPEKTKMETVMEVHDAVMPKMGTIGRLVKELNAKKDSLSQVAAADSLFLAQIDMGLDSLKGGHKQMMDWMKDFGQQFTAEEILKGKALNAEKKAALVKEEIKVNQMEAAINGSISYAESLLAQ